jgi:hypothetical protein
MENPVLSILSPFNSLNLVQIAKCLILTFQAKPRWRKGFLRIGIDSGDTLTSVLGLLPIL